MTLFFNIKKETIYSEPFSDILRGRITLVLSPRNLPQVTKTLTHWLHGERSAVVLANRH